MQYFFNPRRLHVVLAQGTSSFSGSPGAPPDLAQYIASNYTEPEFHFHDSSSEDESPKDDHGFQITNQSVQQGDGKVERKVQKEERKAARKAEKAARKTEKAERKTERKTLKQENKSARKTEKAERKKLRRRDDTWRLVIAYKA